MKQMSAANRRRKFRNRLNSNEPPSGLTVNKLFPFLLVTGYVAAKWDVEYNNGRNIKGCTLDCINFFTNHLSQKSKSQDQ